MVTCKLCGGIGVLLGRLGFLRWFRCRNCGMEFNRKIRRRTRNVRVIPDDGIRQKGLAL